MPISITATSCSGSSLSSCSGRPKWLLRLPSDLSTWKRASSTCATASLVVVLPAEPVTRDDALAPLAAHREGQTLQRVEHGVGGAFGGLRDAEQLAGIDALGLVGREPVHADDGGDGAVGERGFDIVMAVDALALHGEEELAGADGAGVDGVAERLGGGSEIPFGVNQVGDLS